MIVREYLSSAKAPPPPFIFVLTLLHAVFYFIYYLNVLTPGPAKSLALCCLMLILALDGEVVVYISPKFIRNLLTHVLEKNSSLIKDAGELLQKKILVVHHNTQVHLIWAGLAVVFLLIGQEEELTRLNIVSALIVCCLNFVYYQPPKNAITWKQAFVETNECPIAAEARRQNMNKADFERLRLTFHQ